MDYFIIQPEQKKKYFCNQAIQGMLLTLSHSLHQTCWLEIPYFQKIPWYLEISLSFKFEQDLYLYKAGLICIFTSQLVKSGLLVLKKIRVDHDRGQGD